MTGLNLDIVPWIDVAFRLRGERLPLDHGYAIFGAVSRLLPTLHAQEAWAIHPVLGQRLGAGELALTDHSRLRVRLPSTAIADVLPLAGATLEVDGQRVTVGVPEIWPLVPAACLRSRIVIIKGFADAEADFEAALRRQLDPIAGETCAVEVAIGGRRVMRVKNHTVVGFQVELAGLSADASLAVQRVGLGGRRHMGAGVFVPVGRRRGPLMPDRRPPPRGDQ